MIPAYGYEDGKDTTARKHTQKHKLKYTRGLHGAEQLHREEKSAEGPGRSLQHGTGIPPLT